MTPHEVVLSHYSFPFSLRPFQIEAVNTLAPLPSTGLYLHPGLGKTVVSTFCALYKLITQEVTNVVCIMPPILVAQWGRWLRSIKPIDENKHLRILEYAGAPSRRKSLNLSVDFLLMGFQIFKLDFCKVVKRNRWDAQYFTRRPITNGRSFFLIDEAHALKNVGSAIYTFIQVVTEGQSLQLLTGTPLNSPQDGYAYIKLISPDTYRTQAHFYNVHVGKFDIFEKPEEYKNLDKLKENLLINACLKTKEEVLTELPECIIGDIEYELDKDHMGLYKKLANDKLLELKNGEKLDVTQATALYHALGQIVCQWHYFGQDNNLVSNIYNVIDNMLESLGDQKLIIFSNYRRTNAWIAGRYSCPGIWSEISDKQKAEGLKRFIEDPKCRVITAHPYSGGQGVDGFQHVCQNVLYVEPPVTPSHWVQSLSRVHREGQKHAVNVWLAVAKGTMQRYLVNELKRKENLIMPVQGAVPYLTVAEIKKIIFGED